MSDDFDGPCTPGDAEWQRRLDLFLADNSLQHWWWLSFVDTDMPYTKEGDHPGGPRFRGVCVVPGANLVQAISLAHRLGCNPGGQCGGSDLTEALTPGWSPRPEHIGRLFTGDDVNRIAALPPDQLGRFSPDA